MNGRGEACASRRGRHLRSRVVARLHREHLRPLLVEDVERDAAGEGERRQVVRRPRVRAFEDDGEVGDGALETEEDRGALHAADGELGRRLVKVRRLGDHQGVALADVQVGLARQRPLHRERAAAPRRLAAAAALDAELTALPLHHRLQAVVRREGTSVEGDDDIADAQLVGERGVELDNLVGGREGAGAEGGRLVGGEGDGDRLAGGAVAHDLGGVDVAHRELERRGEREGGGPVGA